MSTRNRIPSSLEPYLSLPPELSLLLITGTLGCSPTWLITRLMGSIINNGRQDGPGEEDNDQTSVILVSWMRDTGFWKSELRRSMGLDISKLQSQSRISFIDCLTTSTPNDTVSAIASAITTLKTADPGRKIHLILDSPFLLLATSSSPTTTTAHDLNKTILKLRTQVHSTTIVCSADLPFLSAAQTALSSQRLGSANPASTPLEAETAAFVVQQAHNARVVMSCRELSTGAARDVSGVLRVTRGGDAYSAVDQGETTTGEMPGGCELLYLVNRDGTVKVFERGSSETT